MKKTFDQSFLDRGVSSNPIPPGPLADCASIVDVVFTRARLQPDRLALLFLEDGEDEVSAWTYGEFGKHIVRIATALSKYGISGERALLIYEPGLEYIAAFFGAMAAGAIAVPSYPPIGKRPLTRLQGIFADCAPKLILTLSRYHNELATRLAPLIKAGMVHLVATDDLPLPETTALVPGAPVHKLAMLQYTSGSTGTPRGVMVGHDNLLANCEAVYRWLGPEPERRGSIWLPPFHDMGLLGGVLQPLYSGFPLVFMSPMHFIQRPVRWLKAISNYRITLTGGPNFSYEMCTTRIPDEELEGIDLSCWRHAFCGAEPIRWDTLENFSRRFANYGFRHEAFNPCYGLAEATLIVSGKPVDTAPKVQYFERAALDARRAIPADRGAANTRSLVSCGPIAHEFEVRIVDPDEKTLCEPGVIGEIWVSGSSVTAGYWKRHQENAELFGVGLPDAPGAYMRTGDLGFLWDQELYITGRMKDMMIVAGRNHYPEDIETTVEDAHPSVTAAGAFSVEKDDEERLIIVAEVRRTGQTSASDLAGVREAIVTNVTSAHGIAPFQVHLTASRVIPRTTSGKIQRSACKQLFLEGSLVDLEARLPSSS